jgi:hypothetical protein
LIAPRSFAKAVSLATLTLMAFLVARLIERDIRFAALIVVVVAAAVIPAWLARRRMRKLLLSGDIRRIVGTWQSSIRQVTHPETVNPLVQATAYAAYGFIDGARDALARAAKGPAWDAAFEQRLFVETLLDVFEGERLLALSKAAALEKLPLPPVGFRMRKKIALLRRGVGAFARAFAHQSHRDDDGLLRAVAQSSPLVHWAMRYARAVLLVDRGRSREAQALLSGAPSWPEESAFRVFHDELISHAGS